MARCCRKRKWTNFDSPGPCLFTAHGRIGSGQAFPAERSGAATARHEVEAGCGYEPARGNVILDVGGMPVADAGDVRNALSEAKSQGKHQIMIRAKMGDATRFVALPLGNA